MLPFIKRSKTSRDFQNLPFGNTGIFNPLLAPGNVAIYNGDVNLSAANWRDTSGGNQITFFNAPTFNAAGLNGHGTILFNGTTQYGNSTTPVINSPYTLYLVLRQLSWINNRVIFDDGLATALSCRLFQNNITPRITLVDATGVTIRSPNLTINNFKVVIIRSYTDFIDLAVETNPSAPADGGNYTKNGFTLAVDSPTNLLFSNVEFAYIIMRNQSDPQWLQNNFILWLKNRFAI